MKIPSGSFSQTRSGKVRTSALRKFRSATTAGATPDKPARGVDSTGPTDSSRMHPASPCPAGLGDSAFDS